MRQNGKISVTFSEFGRSSVILLWVVFMHEMGSAEVVK